MEQQVITFDFSRDSTYARRVRYFLENLTN